MIKKLKRVRLVLSFFCGFYPPGVLMIGEKQKNARSDMCKENKKAQIKLV